MGATIVRIYEGGDYDAQIQRAGDILRDGGVVVLPTETVYGGAAVLTSADALARLRSVAPPAQPKPLVVHLARREEAARFIGPAGEQGQRMMKKLWPGPVALVFDVPESRQQDVSRELGVPAGELYDGSTITLRCPEHVVATDVISQAGGPVVVRKAGSTSSRNPEEITRDWADAVDLILDAGPTKYSKPSTIVRVLENGYEIVRQGVYDQRIIERLLRTTILFVCSGNTCRSPMAEAIARQLLARKLSTSEAELEKKGVSVLSAGSFAMPGAKATPQAVDALRPIGADLSRHRSRPLTVELIHQADLIFTMGRSHAQAVTALVPSAMDKVTTLNPEGDIDDPIGGDLALYQSLAGQLQSLIEKRLEEHALP